MENSSTLAVISELHNFEKDPRNSDAKKSLNCRRLSEVQSVEIKWLWTNRIPQDTLTIVEGDGGRGKSTIIADICSRLSSGRKLQDDDVQREPINCLLLALEDDPGAVLKPRFERHHADLNRIFFDDQGMLLNETGIEALRATIRANKIGLVVIDPIVAFLGSRLDMNKGNDVRSVLGPLVKMGRDEKCTFIVVRHFNKTKDGSASQRGAGSVDFRNAARSVLQVIHSDEKSYLALEKTNYAARAQTLPFAIEERAIVWGTPCDVSADQLHGENIMGAENKSAVEEAVDFLKTELKDDRPAKDVIQSARDSGISEKALNKAKKKLGVKSEKVQVGTRSHWMWKKVEDGQGAQDDQQGNVGNLDHLALRSAAISEVLI